MTDGEIDELIDELGIRDELEQIAQKMFDLREDDRGFKWMDDVEVDDGEVQMMIKIYGR